MEFTILVIDDSYLNRLYLSTLLTTQGFRIIEASGGEEALELIQNHTIDLIILDFMMPHMDGLQFMEEMRTLNYFIPTIICSAVYDQSLRTRCLLKGARAFINKPIMLTTIMKTINTIRNE